MQQQELQLNNDAMNTLSTETDYLVAAYHAIPKRARRGSLADYLQHEPSAKALRMYAHAIRERMEQPI